MTITLQQLILATKLFLQTKFSAAPQKLRSHHEVSFVWVLQGTLFVRLFHHYFPHRLHWLAWLVPQQDRWPQDLETWCWESWSRWFVALSLGWIIRYITFRVLDCKDIICKVGTKSASEICGGFGDGDCSIIHIPSEHVLEIWSEPLPLSSQQCRYIIICVNITLL